MHNLTHSLTDAFALASASLDKGCIDLPHSAVADNALFNVWVIEENGARTLVRENVTGQLASALVISANHGANTRGLAHTYEAVQVEALS